MVAALMTLIVLHRCAMIRIDTAGKILTDNLLIIAVKYSLMR